MEETKADGWLSFAGGMRLSDGARAAVGNDQAEILVNATVRHGRAEPRPAWRRLPIAWGHRLAQPAFERGVIQGSAFYDSPAGPRFVYVADGHILSFDPVEMIMRLVSPKNKAPFHPLARHAWLQQRGRWMVCQDGINPPVILDGEQATINSDPYSGVPTGMMMADGWNRLAIVGPDRKKLYFSDHEYDPESGPLKFDDDQYFKNARYFELPRSLGPAVGIAFAPSFNNQTDWGPLLVFCERGVRAYQLQVPREAWLDQDISVTLLPTIGACAHGAITQRGNDVVFSDHEGRIQTLKQAIAERDNVRVQPADQAVWGLYRGEMAGYRRWRKSARFDGRMLTTVWPEPLRLGNGRLGVRHRGLVVMEEDHLSDRPFVWAGLWTGIYPVTLDSGGVKVDAGRSPVERCIAVSHDPDGIHRLYELGTSPGPDIMPDPRRVSMWVVPRWLDWETPFRRKKIDTASLQLDGIRGRVSIQGWWQVSGGQPKEWFRHEDAAGDCLLFSGCEIIEPAPAGLPKVNLPAPPERTEFFRARPWFRITGETALEEGVFSAATSTAKPGSDVSCTPVQSAVVQPKSCIPNYWERHSAESTPEPPLPVQICNPKFHE